MKDFSKARFISFEGGEGSGKSTQSKKLHEYLLARNINCILTREVGGTKEAEEIRNLLVHSQLFTISELLMVMAARYEHVNSVIVPALDAGLWVICDRFVDSTACYQSAVGELGIEEIFALHSQLIRKEGAGTALMPDITFFMDLPPGIGVKRSLATGDINKFEAKDTSFHQAVYEKFCHLAGLYPERIRQITCQDRTTESIHQDIISLL